MKRAATYISIFLAGIFIGICLGQLKRPTSTEEKVECITVHDTIKVPVPECTWEAVVGTRPYKTTQVPKKEDIEEAKELTESNDGDINDSVIISLPIIQRCYSDSAYTAWVSGPVDPQLDSIKIMATTKYITKTMSSHKRWHLGLSAGAAYTPRGIQPYIGVGLTYSIISF